MALSRENHNSQYAATITSTLSLTITSANFLLARVAVRTTDGASISGITYAGEALTYLGRQNGITDSGRRVEIWYKVNPATGTNDAVLTLSAAAKSAFSVQGIIGVNTSAPLGTPAGANGTSSPATVNVSSATDEMVFDVAAHSDGLDMVVGGGQTSQFDYTNGSFVGCGSYEDPGASTTTMSWTFSGSPSYGWCIYAVSVKPAAAGGLSIPVAEYNRRMQGMS